MTAAAAFPHRRGARAASPAVTHAAAGGRAPEPPVTPNSLPGSPADGGNP